MSEETQGGDGGDVEVELEEKKGLSGKKLVLFIVLPLLLILGGGAAAFFLGVFDPPPEETVEEVVEEEGPPALGPSVFHDMPELLVNLSSTSGNRTSFLKIVISLELTSDLDIPAVEAVMPRIVDNFQVYLRELRVEDLRGSAGIQRLREELLLRVNASAAPVVVKDVLFQEMLVQ
ncbi:flagellar basal body-associated FliL family protein [Kiloniella sp. b19]|uniref:flagellar basal body-associated FliL family protein n=1 Tax=Kiloniella sp. GXU_MW_B19 TaxID=3141326 RepID=UPI0031CFB448